ncbi:putative oca3 protein [Aspergillus bombycis]|uniref:ER membrane protein complex subunit 2 n=1 Tax=Aspergillus bombycis TaxID=109264 RepID=A0A1F7ZTS7_9EURO|nr:putative oca3 protein [Aspergillus bombycis]OGM42854.1 putative oca3 protein [Aspergillus bombycis]
MAHATPESYAIQSSSPITTLRFSQQAPVILKHQLHPKKNPVSALIAKQEEPEKYSVIEQLFFSCLQTGDDRSALLCLEQLTCRFGSSNEKVMGLRGLYEEAIAENQSDLEDSLRKYDSCLSENPLNLPILKRRIALLRSLSRPTDAITGLVELLKAVPTDAEAWCELADLYQSQGLSSQAIFSLEEALLVAPNAWNACVHCLLSLQNCLTSTADSRSPWRNSVHLRPHYRDSSFLSATSLQLKREYAVDFTQASSSASTEDFLPKGKAEKLNILARRKLEEIVKQRSGNRQLWEHAQGELNAAQELLDRDSC